RTVGAVHCVGLLAGIDLAPGDLAPALVGLGHGGVEDAHRRLPDVGPGAVALDEGDDRVVGHLKLAVSDGDLVSRGNRDSAGHTASFRSAHSTRSLIYRSAVMWAHAIDRPVRQSQSRTRRGSPRRASGAGE